MKPHHKPLIGSLVMLTLISTVVVVIRSCLD